MLRGWLAVLAVLVGIGFSFAADSNSPLSKEKRWEEGRKSLANGNPVEARAAFQELLKKYPQEADLHLFLGITLLRLREPQAAEAAAQRERARRGGTHSGEGARRAALFSPPPRRCGL